MLIQRNNKMKTLMISSQEGEIKINLMKGNFSILKLHLLMFIYGF